MKSADKGVALLTISTPAMVLVPPSRSAQAPVPMPGATQVVMATG